MRLSTCPCGSGAPYQDCCQEQADTQRAPVAVSNAPATLSIQDILQDALRLHQENQLQHAATLYRSILEQEPANADALNLLGTAHAQQGQYDLAIQYIAQAIEANGTVPDYYQNLSTALREVGDLVAATGCLREAVQQWPAHLPLRQLLGDTLLQWGDSAAAAEVFRDALLLCLSDTQGLEWIAGLLQRYEQIQQENRRDPVLYYRLADVLKRQGKWLEARAAYEQALHLSPDLPGLRSQLAWLQQSLCAWDGLESLWSDIREGVRSQRDGGMTIPCFFIYTNSTAAEQLAGARSWAATHYAAFETEACEVQRRWSRPGPRERLHIGYLSSDYRTHAVAHMMAEIFEQHDRSRVTVSAYSIGPDDDSPLRARIVRSVDRFVGLHGMRFRDAAERILADRVDILVDLDSYSHPAECQVQALRPAPIQVGFVGYPGTTGAPFLDYVIANRSTIPPEHAVHFSERVAYLPDWGAPPETKRIIAPDTPTRKECGLPESGFVFCSFNQLYKITPSMFALWMRLLAGTPGSVLWLLSRNTMAEANLRREAAGAGIDPLRLTFDPYLPRAEYFARHHLADLALDTLPGSGGATTSDALWMGLPVLTCPGETYTSRLAGSQLHAAGLPELVAATHEEYEAIALTLAHDPDRLAELRARLAGHRNRVSRPDGSTYSRDLESLYLRIWEEYCRAQDSNLRDHSPLSV